MDASIALFRSSENDGDFIHPPIFDLPSALAHDLLDLLYFCGCSRNKPGHPGRSDGHFLRKNRLLSFLSKALTFSVPQSR